MADFGAQRLELLGRPFRPACHHGLDLHHLVANQHEEEAEVLQGAAHRAQAGSGGSFAGGIYGTVKGIEGEKVQIKVRSGAVVDVSRYAIQEIK